MSKCKNEISRNPLLSLTAEEIQGRIKGEKDALFFTLKPFTHFCGDWKDVYKCCWSHQLKTVVLLTKLCDSQCLIFSNLMESFMLELV